MAAGTRPIHQSGRDLVVKTACITLTHVLLCHSRVCSSIRQSNQHGSLRLCFGSSAAVNVRELDALVAQRIAAGELVRKLKEEKADAAAIEAAVQSLQRAKDEIEKLVRWSSVSFSTTIRVLTPSALSSRPSRKRLPRPRSANSYNNSALMWKTCAVVALSLPRRLKFMAVRLPPSASSMCHLPSL
jgi:hypothetical protein